MTGTGGERGLAEPTGAALPAPLPARHHPALHPQSWRSAASPLCPIPPPHSVWDCRWTSGACQEAERAGDSSFGPSPPHSLQTQAGVHILLPALGNPQPSACPASPMSECGGSHLMRYRWCHGDPQTKPNPCLQAQALLWTKPSEHLLEAPSSGPRQPPQPCHGGPQSLQSPRSHTVLGQDPALSSSSRRKVAVAFTLPATGHWLASAGGQCWGTSLVHPSEHHWSPEQASRAGGGSCSAPEHRVSICHPLAPVQAGPTGARISAGRPVGRKEVRTQEHGVITFSLNIRATLTQQRKGGQGPQPAAPFAGTWPWPGAPASHCQDEQTRQQRAGSGKQPPAASLARDGLWLSRAAWCRVCYNGLILGRDSLRHLLPPQAAPAPGSAWAALSHIWAPVQAAEGSSTGVPRARLDLCRANTWPLLQG